MNVLKVFLRSLLPALATVLLSAMLLVAIYFTWLDWEWVTFLAGTLFAALLALASRASQAEWRVRRRTLQLAQAKERLAQEIAARRRGEEALRASEDQSRLISDALPHMLAYFDTAQRYRYHNRAFREWLGLRSSEIDGRTVSEVLGQEFYAEIADEIATALSGKRVTYERTRAMARGALYRLSVTLTPHFDDAGRICGCFGLLTDVTERDDLGKAPEAVSADDDARELPAGAPLIMSGADGQTLYLNSITEQLTGWSDPQARLRQALDRDEFRLYYQDIVGLSAVARGGRFHEILIRLQEEEQNLTPPGAFIPVAEQFNMTTELDRWVLRHVVEFQRRYQTAHPGVPAPVCAINLFASTLSDRQFPVYVYRSMTAHGVAPQSLCFEIAESEALDHMPEAIRFVTALRRMGCQIALGGFGVGKVSFDTLKHLPVNFVKIDGSVIRSMDDDPVGIVRIKAICRVSKVIGVRTVAQFVESRQIMDALAEVGIDYAQGFGVSLPQPLSGLG